MSLAARWRRFWFESEVLRSRLTSFRVVVFGMLAFDMWMLMFAHAPRYGVAGFNVSHIPALDPFLPMPTPALVGALYLLGGFLALRVAMGVTTRGSLVGLTAIYGGLYLWSQADSYQHHYLIALILLLCWWLPHEVMPGIDEPGTEGEARESKVRSWAAKLLYVEVSIVYFYTAVTKTTDYWLDGWALNRIIQTDGMREFLALWPKVMGTGELGGYAFTAHVIMLWQYFVAGAFLFPKLRPIACITGPMFHILVEVIDLKIGWFSYYMIGIYYILLFPDRWFLAVARPIGILLGPAKLLFWHVVKPRDLDWLTRAMTALAAALVSATAVYSWIPMEGAGLLSGAIGAVVGLSLCPNACRFPQRVTVRAGAQVLGVLAMIVALRASDSLYDYHRFRPGDFKRRGQLEQAAEGYEIVNALRKEGKARHFALAEVYVRLGRTEDARRAYIEGLAREPDSDRGREGLERLGITP